MLCIFKKNKKQKLTVAVSHALQPQNNKRGPESLNNPSRSKINNGGMLQMQAN